MDIIMGIDRRDGGICYLNVGVGLFSFIGG